MEHAIYSSFREIANKFPQAFSRHSLTSDPVTTAFQNWFLAYDSSSPSSLTLTHARIQRFLLTLSAASSTPRLASLEASFTAPYIATGAG